MSETPSPTVEAAMLIRKPPEEVFEAFVNPELITGYWFTHSSGRLEEGARVTWTWEMFGASARVDVKTVETNRRVVFEWPEENGTSTVEVSFLPHEGSTFVRVRTGPFEGDGDAPVKSALDSTQGFTIVLCGMKVFLEHGIRPNLLADRFPKEVAEHP